MADQTIAFEFKEGDIFYSLDGKEFLPLEEDTVIGVDEGSQVTFKIANPTISKILGLQVNLDKGNRENYGEVWKSVPTEKEAGEWVGTTLEKVEKQRYNGWTIFYQTPDGQRREKDPDVKMPQLP
ncbi:MAG: hypothetical protein AAGA85_10660 [Bacteroidota bacterium]